MTTTSDDTTIQHVLVMIAMAAEAEPLLAKLNLSVIPCNTANSPCIMYSGIIIITYWILLY